MTKVSKRTKARGAFRAFNQNLRNFRDGGKWYENILGKVLENPKIVEFPKCVQLY